MKKKIVSILLVGALIFQGCGMVDIFEKPKEENEIYSTEEEKTDAEGIWSREYWGTWETTLTNGTDLLFEINCDKQEVYVTSETMGCKDCPIYNVWYSEDELTIFVDHGVDYYRISLSYDDSNNTLEGEVKYLDDTEKVTFAQKRKSIAIGNSKSLEWEHTYEELQQMIKDFSKYSEDGMEYEIQFDIGNKAGYEEIIEQYGLDEALDGKEDIALMKAALAWEEGVLNHISSHITDERDLASLLNDGVVSNLNCRGLSLVLSQVLRMYGVKAQIIGCMPYADMSSDCHIIVRAYSEELEKWVMLDPTYCLIIQDETGSYIDVCELRENIANNTKMYYNEEAGYNDSIMTDEGFNEYLAYMAKNSCYYTIYETNEDNSDNSDNTAIMLVSENYENACDLSEECGMIITTNAEKFWK